MIETTDKAGIKVENNDRGVSLIALRKGSDGKFYDQWATYQMGKDKHADKDWPVKVIAGNNPDDAVTNLLSIIHELTGKWYVPDETPF